MTQPSRSRLRLTFLTVMPSPYMRDLFDAIDRDGRFHLRVLYLEREAVAAPGVYWKDRPLPAYAAVLPGRWYWFWGARVHVNSRVVSTIRADRPDVVVVSGYFSVTCQLAMWWLGLTRTPWLFWGEVPGFERRGAMARFLRWLAQRPAVWLPAAVAGIGVRAARAYRAMTPANRPVWNIPYCCDLEPYRPTGAGSSAPGLRFLYCGQLVPRKGVDLLVRAFARVAADFHNVTLTLVGGGPMKDELLAMIPKSIRPRVTFAGFREPEELPQFYAAADVFVLPSRHDGWGLVVNQAVGAGLPVVVSSAVGAGDDLVKDGVNGTVVPPEDENALAVALRAFARDPGRAAVQGATSQAIAQQVAPMQLVDRWYELLVTVADRRTYHLPDRFAL